MGRDLDGGVVTKRAQDEVKQLGIVPMMVRALLQHGAVPDPNKPATADSRTTRQNFSHYPVLFDEAAAQ